MVVVTKTRAKDERLHSGGRERLHGGWCALLLLLLLLPLLVVVLLSRAVLERKKIKGACGKNKRNALTNLN